MASTVLLVAALLSVTHAVVVDLTSDNFDQVASPPLSNDEFSSLHSQFVDGSRSAFVEFYAPCKL